MMSLQRCNFSATRLRINQEGSQAMQVGDSDTAQAVIDFAKRLTAFLQKVSDLGGEWEKLEELRDKASTEVQQIVSKRFFGKSRKGEITPQETYSARFSKC